MDWRVWALGVTMSVALTLVSGQAAGGEDRSQPASRPATAGAPGEPGEAAGGACLLERESLADNWFGLGRELEQKGLTARLGLTQVYQLNLEGGLATHRHAGRYAGSYDLEATADLEKLLKLPGASIYALAEGAWSRGLNDSSIGSLLGINADAAGDEAIYLSQLFYEQRLLERRVALRVGKLDLTGTFECRGCPVSFDGSLYANDETSQFLSDSLVNNPTIPFPDYGLGAVLHVEPVEGFYVSVGAADAQADARETGFRTAFHGRDCFFGILETGLAGEIAKGHPGACRFGLWYDPQPKERFGGGTKRDDVGFYMSADQLVWKENDEPDDAQGLGVFARFGAADDDVSEIHAFWSVGGQYQGLIPGRNGDVAGLGVAQGLLSRHAAGGRASQETVIEAYYGAQITGWLRISGHVQYVSNPGGTNELHDAVVVGIRAQMSF